MEAKITKNDFSEYASVFVLMIVAPGLILIWTNILLYFICASLSTVSFIYIKVFILLRNETKWFSYLYWSSTILLFLVGATKYIFVEMQTELSTIYLIICLIIGLFSIQRWFDFQDQYFKSVK